VLAHEGTKAYAEAFDLIHRREADRPNAIWQADHTLLDILLVRDASKPAANLGLQLSRMTIAAL
jgi:putative transposase